MVRSYLKYEQSHAFGTITTSTSNTIFVPPTSTSTPTSSTSRTTSLGKAYTAANEEVLCWDIKTGELVSRWRDNACTAQVTAIARSKTDADVFAVGYHDGSIRVWDARIGKVLIRFNGHRSAVTILAFDGQGVRVASGSRDTDIIIWDLVSETGLFRLRGHKEQITGICFLSSRDGDEQGGEPEKEDQFLLSTSKDALVKIWDVASQYCVETHVTQSNGECWSLGMSPDGSGCITGGNEGELKVWSLDLQALTRHSAQLQGGKSVGFLEERGTLNRHGADRTIGIRFHATADYFAVHGTDKSVEVWRIRSPAEVEKQLARKAKRKREKARTDKDVNGDTEMVNGDHENDKTAASTAVTDVFVPHVIVRTSGKTSSVDWAGGSSSKSLRLLTSTTNNQMELYNITARSKSKSSRTTEEPPDYDRTHGVELPGHRADVRAVALSSDDRMLATASNGALKIWNTRTGSSIRTLECGYALACAFLPGDKIVLVCTKSGEIELFDIASATHIDTVKAHDGAIWSLKVHPDGRSIVTGSADKSAKFWRFEVVQEDIPGTKRTMPTLKLIHTRTLKLQDEILSLCFTPDSRLLAVSTLDNTVKVFFLDSLKLFLNLYGHKLPVLNISIASDSKLIATCSADKNVRLWGLDFGDCHKSIFAHDDSILQVSFISRPIQPKEDGHLFFTASKDGLIKSWDGDKFEHIQKLSGHHGEIWTMAVSQTGDFVATASHDKSIRIWSQTDEPLFLEEERERELEDAYDANIAEGLARDQADAHAAMIDGQDEAMEAVVPATKQTGETLTSGERITEALNMCHEDLIATREYEAQRAANPTDPPGPPQRHPVLSFKDASAEKHLLGVLESIAGPSLQDALLLLTFSTLPPLFDFLNIWLEKNMNVHLACKVCFFLLRVHHKQVVASRELRPVLSEMQGRLRDRLEGLKNMMGFNLAGLKILSRRVDEVGVSRIDIPPEDDETSALGRKKRGFVSVG
ncbi:MAG: hypothetical protein M1828_001936 [Chrysothrix sp. TS-e1954]|nr:MAG: hypothetical protein M1828_001936 [Chrysothrix sp. TS-e1954]